jgi:hypothetical protein
MCARGDSEAKPASQVTIKSYRLVDMNGSSRDAKRVGNDANPAPQETKTIPEIAKPEVGHPGSQRYERDDDQLEFGRVVNYSDAVFAIASTLLVVGIGIPTVQAGRLPDQLSDLGLEIMSFFISFLVIGYYWMAHHRFVAAVRCFDTGLISLNLVLPWDHRLRPVSHRSGRGASKTSRSR